IPFILLGFASGDVLQSKLIGFDIGYNDNFGGIGRTTMSMYSGTNQNYQNTSQFSNMVLSPGQAVCTSEVTLADAATIKVISKPAPFSIQKSGPITLCENENVRLSVDNTVAGVSYQWFKNGIPLNDSTKSNITVSNVGSYNVLISSASNCSDSAETAVAVTNRPTPPQFTVTPIPPTTCGGAGILQLKGLVSGTEYQINTNTPGEADTNKLAGPNGIDLIRAANTYTSVKVGLNSGCSKTVTGTFPLLPPGQPVAPAFTGKQNYCAGETSEKLTPSGVDGASFKWYKSLDPKMEINAPFTPDVSEAGTKTYFLTQTVNNCESPATQIPITVNSLPEEKTLSGGGSLPCNDKGQIIVVLQSSSTVEYELKLGGNNVATQSGTGTNLKFENISSTGLYTIRAKNKGNECSWNILQTIEIRDPERPSKFEVSGDVSGCEGSVAKAEIVLSASEENVSYTLSNTGISKAGTNGALTFEVPPLQSSNGTYTITAKNLSTECTNEMKGTATVAIEGPLGDPSISSTAEFCNTRIDSVKAIALNAQEFNWRLDPSNAGAITKSGLNTALITWNSDYVGEPKILVEVTKTSCNAAAKRSSKVVSVSAPPIVTDIIGDTLACKESAVVYLVKPNEGITFDWSVTINSRIEKNDSQGTARITFNDEILPEGVRIKVVPVSSVCGAGVAKSKTIRKDVNCEVFVPNVLVPSAQDDASYWYISGIERFNYLNIEVFNRWGDRVYQQKGKYDKPWDGRVNGRLLPTATYYYVISKQNGNVLVTGSLTLVSE
ncbi:MAG TPA: gliding motility-associated C-terminal domain-containing protein, partial [Cytophagaceae bacterium]